MQSIVRLGLKVLIVILIMTTLKELSIYWVTRRGEDASSNQLPKELVYALNDNTNTRAELVSQVRNDKNGKSLKPININKVLRLNGVSVVWIKPIGSKSPYKEWGFNNEYRDSNANGLVDMEDKGYITPGSMMKVLVAYCLYKNKDVSESKEGVVKKALVVSDNDAANKMIDWLGGVNKIQECFESEGFDNTYMNREFGSSNAEGKKGCKEGGVYSNCTIPKELIRVMEYIVSGNNELGLYLPNERRERLKEILSLRPRNIGVNKPDDYCAFLKEVGPQKCGVALLDNSIGNIAYIPGKQIVVFVGYSGKDKIPEREMSVTVQSIYGLSLEGAGTK